MIAFAADPAAVGRAFHAELHAKAPWIQHHPDDPAHDHHVGLAVLSMREGRMTEAVEAYNAWAVGAGYATIRLLDDDRVDIRDTILRIEGDSFEVEQLRLLTTAEEIDEVFAPHYERGQTAADLMALGCRFWGFDGGAFLCRPRGGGVMEVHTALKPGANYRHAVACGKKAIEQEITAGCALMVKTPKPNRRALHFALACGMKFYAETDKEWLSCRSAQ